MTLASIAKTAERFLQDNSPLILTGIGTTGVISVAYLTGRATFKAAAIIEHEKYMRYRDEKFTEVTAKEEFNLVWRLYIPAAATGVLAISCIVLANRVGTRRATAMAAAYTLSEKAFAEYKDKVVEKMGANKERKVRDELAQERVSNNKIKEVIITGSGDVLCYDSFSGRYFRSSVENIKKAMNDINYVIIHEDCASLGDFYEKIGLPQITMSEELGWTSDKMLDVYFSTALSDDSQPCISIEFSTEPIRSYYRTH